MDYVNIILSAAKTAKVSGQLLLAICTHESGLKNTYVPEDGGSPSHGLCQVKEDTAKMLGFKGKPEDLLKPQINAKYAALYLRYQMNRYKTNDWCVLASSYNAGSFNESKKYPGKPRNLKYIRHVQKVMPEELKSKLSCNYKMENK